MSNDDDLLAAYLDGVAELDADERRRVDELLRDHPETRAEAEATRGVLDRLRALPAEGHEPDWNVLERKIRAEVGADVPRPWWRRARWLVPIGALAATAAIALLWARHETPAPRTAIATVPLHDADATATEPTVAPTALWLDGQAVELGDVDPAALDDSHDTLAAGPEPETTDDDLGILPVDDLGWIDTLDDNAIDRAEHWLARKKG